MNFRNEVDYRLAKMLLANLYHDGILTEKKRDRLWEKLLEYYEPPFKSVEEVGGKIGEGFILNEIRSGREKKTARRKGKRNTQEMVETADTAETQGVIVNG